MKVCPFCREEIRDEAIKCRHCSSSLLPAQPSMAGSGATDAPPEATKTGATPAPGADQIVYIVDQDLIRFMKFAGAVLAIVLAIGTLLYGVDIKQTTEKVRESQDKVRESQDKLRDSSDKVRDVWEKISKTAGDVESAGKDISATQQRALQLFADAQQKNQDFQRKVQDVEGRISKTAGEIERAEKDVSVNQQKAQKLIAGAEQNVRGSQEKVRAVEDRIAKIASEVETAKKSVGASQREAQNLLATAEKLVGKIRQQWVLTRGGPGTGSPTVQSSNLPASSTGFSVPQIVGLYDFPKDLDGTGQTIGLIELGGGYTASDLDAYFARLKLPRPKVTSVSVAGAKNQPDRNLFGADSQVTLDVEVAGSVAPAAHIVVYFAPNTNAGFLDAVRTAVTDVANRPSVLVINWGGPEANFTLAFMNQMNTVLKDAGNRGITVVVAAGDKGATDGIKDGKRHVDFPASSPWALAVGGTRVTAIGDRIASETAWNSGGGATGGGVSAVFARPDWQAGVNIPTRPEEKIGRGIPDVAANAAPETGYEVYIHGQYTLIGGTSAVTPLWAGLIARINQGVGRNIGYINPVLYTRIGPARVLRPIIEGNNGVDEIPGYAAGPGWNAVTGWGSPDGRKLLDAFRMENAILE